MDALYFFMVAVTAFFSLLIAGLIVFFAVKYRRRHDEEVGVAIHGSLALELFWTIIPFFIAMGMFVWGAKVFFDLYRVRPGRWRSSSSASSGCGRCSTSTGSARSTSCTCRSGRPVKLIMASEDVIHGFYIPAFRVKTDVVPGPLQHAVVRGDQAGPLSPVLRGVLRHEALGDDRQGRRDGAGRVPGVAERRRRPRIRRPRRAKSCSEPGCVTCHTDDGGAAARPGGVFGHAVELQGGSKVMADEAYLRESIVNRRRRWCRVPAGHAAIPGQVRKSSCCSSSRT